MAKVVKRGYVPEDALQFSENALPVLKKASEEVKYLLDCGYPVKAVTEFIGNHYLFSERQRLSLARSVSSSYALSARKTKELSAEELRSRKVYIDGFNTVITLEVALSGSPLFRCMDGTYRDLAEICGTYSVIDKTEPALKILFKKLSELGISEAVIYLDRPVSNAGRLKAVMQETAQQCGVPAEILITDDVDRKLAECPGVITGDAIILDQCRSWFNVIKGIVEELPGVRTVDLR